MHTTLYTEIKKKNIKPDDVLYIKGRLSRTGRGMYFANKMIDGRFKKNETIVTAVVVGIYIIPTYEESSSSVLIEKEHIKLRGYDAYIENSKSCRKIVFEFFFPETQRTSVIKIDSGSLIDLNPYLWIEKLEP